MMLSFTDMAWMAAAAGEHPGFFEKAQRFFVDGGVIMAAILFCSVVALAVTLYQIRLLRTDRVLPPKVVAELDRLPEFAEREDTSSLQALLKKDQSVLSRSAELAFAYMLPSREEAEKAVEGKAREELHRLEWGAMTLDVIITIAPLLGLFGTVTGLVEVFSALGSGTEGTADMNKIAAGIALALNTTIAGIGVAVPCVVAHGFITRRVESLAIRMEVVLNRAIQMFYRHFEFHEMPVESSSHTKTHHAGAGGK